MIFGWNTEWSGTVVIGDLILPNNYELSLSFDILTDEKHEQGVLFDRMKYIIEVMDTAMMVDLKNPLVAKLYKLTKSHIITLPTEPADQIIAATLFSKFNHILEGKAEIITLGVSSSLGDRVLNTVDQDDDQLFDLLKESEIKALTGKEAWYHRADSGCTDIVLITKKRAEVIREVIPWDDLELGWEPLIEQEIEEDASKMLKYRKKGWKPEIIDGGKA